METNPLILGLSSLDVESFSPMTIDGAQHGQVHFIRDDVLHDRVNRVALWELNEDQLPYESPYFFKCDETILVLKGELEITFDDGKQIVLRADDVISIAAGTSSSWKILQPFKKLVVETGF